MARDTLNVWNNWKRLERLEPLDVRFVPDVQILAQGLGSGIESPQQADEVSERIAKGVTPECINRGSSFRSRLDSRQKTFGNEGL